MRPVKWAIFRNALLHLALGATSRGICDILNEGSFHDGLLWMRRQIMLKTKHALRVPDVREVNESVSRAPLLWNRPAYWLSLFVMHPHHNTPVRVREEESIGPEPLRAREAADGLAAEGVTAQRHVVDHWHFAGRRIDLKTMTVACQVLSQGC
jgi:hypothetical protein